MKKVHITIYVLLLVLLLKITSSYMLNENFISSYKKGVYNEGILSILSIANIWQPYIVHYNNGNRLYKSGDYKGAIEEYKKALKLFPSKDEECSIRINLALAMIKNIENSQDPTIDDILEVLNDAKEVLYEDGCANKNNNNGHSKKAEQLKKDIEDYEELLKQQKQNSNGDDDENKDQDDENGDSDEDNQDEEEMKKKEEQIKQQQKNNNESRQQTIEQRKIMSEYDFYNGKKW